VVATGLGVPGTNENTNTGNQVNVIFIIVNDAANWPHNTDRTLPLFRVPGHPKTSRRGRILPRVARERWGHPTGRVGRVGITEAGRDLWASLVAVVRRSLVGIGGRIGM